jgi:hypothetical protein
LGGGEGLSLDSLGDAGQVPRLPLIPHLVVAQYCLQFLPLLLWTLWGQLAPWPPGAQPSPSAKPQDAVAAPSDLRHPGTQDW